MIRIFICCFIPSVLCSQVYNKSWDLGGTERLCPIIIKNNEIYVCGMGYNTNSEHNITKIAPSGDTIFSRKYLNNMQAVAIGLSGAGILSESGNIFFCGISGITANNLDACLIGYDATADSLWKFTYGFSGDDQLNSLVGLPDSSIWLAGKTETFDSWGDIYLVHTDPVGNFLSYKKYGSTGVYESGTDIIRTLDNGMLIAGVRANIHYILKTDSAGNFLWDRSYPGTEMYPYVTALPDSGFILTSYVDVAGLNAQCRIAKIDKNGNEIWVKKYGGFNEDYLATKPIILNDGSIVAAGSQNDNGIIRGLAIKLSPNGDSLWCRTYEYPGATINYIWDIEQTGNGDFIMAGNCLNQSADYWLVRTDSLGCELTSCLVGFQENSSIEETLSFPVPPKDFVFLPFKTSGIIEIFSVDGKMVRIENFIPGQVVNVSGLSRGIYFVVEKKSGERTRFVKE